MQTETICCCGARTWTLVIGCFQTIIWSSCLVFGILAVARYEWITPIFAAFLLESEIQQSKAYFYGIVLTTVCLICLLFSCLLIVGVKQANVIKVKIWWAFQTVCTILQVLRAIRALFGGHFNGILLLKEIIAICFNMFFVFVVGIHVKELEKQNPGHNTCC